MKNLIERIKREWAIMVNTSDDTTPFWFALAAVVISLLALLR